MDGNEKAQHNREAFQLERVILFTDAVFAIAITLLVIELKVPELEHRTEQEAINGLLRLIPKFIGFLISFGIIAIYWTAHHRIFRFVRHLDGKLIWLNLAFLLSIVLMPFTTAYQSEYGMLATPWVLYSVNIIATGLLQARIQMHLRNPTAGLVAEHERHHPDLDLVRPMMTPLVFGLSIGLAFFVHPWVLRLLPGVIFPLLSLYFGKRHRRLEQAYNQPAPAPEAVEST
ncbi:TMEM175 family protein [Hymenobacter terricola]|uniref:TMEM175 family protein n=1 Tax=Hymenobacter terricola TaxID=2819236 RepID=UPI001B314EEC|nr:TMEM175 family protein [Hymenobacter terricola]